MTTANDPTQELERRIEVLENYLKEHVATREQAQQIQAELESLKQKVEGLEKGVEGLKKGVEGLQEDATWTRGKVDDLTASVQAIREHFGI